MTDAPSKPPATVRHPPLLAEEASAVQRAKLENERLRQQVKRLMAAENKLYTLQGHLSAQQRVYVRLSELARTLNTLLDVDKILHAVVEFGLYGFNFERCVALLEDAAGDGAVYRVAAYDGYYDEAESRWIEAVVLTGSEPALASALADPGFVCHAGEGRDADGLALGEQLQLDEYFVFALPRKVGRPLGFIAAGNTRDQARYQTEVAADGEMRVAFSNLASQTATAINQVRSYRALERERELLDQMVAERTRELSEALDAAHEAVRVKAEFLAKVSHELRTPLNSIVNVPAALLDDYAEIQVYRCSRCDAQFRSDDGSGVEAPTCPECGGPLTEEPRRLCVGDQDEHYRFLGLLQQQGHHLLSLVEDVLDMSRLEAGRVELNLTEVDVGPLLEEIRVTLASAKQGGDRCITYPELVEPVRLFADRVKLKQILLNLIGNAIKFTGRGGEIRVSVERGGGARPTVVFTVADDGIGIPEDQIDAIFESFHQVDGSHTRAFGGAGLGLAICRQLTEMHGGRITVTSRLQEGSRFRVELPADRELGVPLRGRTSRPPTPAFPYPAHGHGTVVVVDDEPAELSMARKLLEREGYDVVLVSRAQEALETVRRTSPRFIVLDVMMPDVSGLAVFAELQRDERTAHIPVFVSTAYHQNKRRVVGLGGLWLPKPWSARVLSAENLESMMAALPTGDRGGEGPEPRPRSRLSRSISRVLYVEDEDANWEVTQLSLRGKCELVRARTSREAFERVSEQVFDLILMDIQLAGSDLSGIAVAEALTGRRREGLPSYASGIRTSTPIVFVTAYSSLHSREDLIASGAQELITKPVDFAHLLMVISRLMARGTLAVAGER